VRNVNVSERNPLDNGLECYIGLEHIDPESLHIKRWGLIEEGTSFTRKFVKGQVLFGKRRAYQRKVAVAEFDGICSGDILVFEPKNDQLIPELLPFIVQSNGFFNYALGTSAGSLSPRTNWTALAAYEFVLPPKDEQHRIADILLAADESIVKIEQVLSATESLRRALINNIVSQNLNFFELQIDDSGSEEYRVVKLHEVCKRITDGTHQPPKFCTNGIPFLLVSNLTSGKIDWNVSKWISEETYEELTRNVKPEMGDVLYTVVGSFGVPVLINWNQLFSFQRHIALLKPNVELLEGAYLAYFLESSLGREQARLTATGNAQKTITLSALKEFLIPLPPLNEQKQIVKKNHSAVTAASLASQQIAQLKQLKSGLIRKLLTSGQDYV
jgi:restriction endonuclease S subunit